VETILFDPGFIPSGIRNNCLNTFSVCKFICVNPVPFPSVSSSLVAQAMPDFELGDVFRGASHKQLGFGCCSLVVQRLAFFSRWTVTCVLFIAWKCNGGFITSICLHCKPISEHVHFFSLLFVSPEPLDRVWTQFCSSACFWLYFLLWKKHS